MTPEEKIEAVRKWAKPADDYRLDGYYQAQCQVRDIIDPPKPECCTDGTCDECAPLFEWAEYRKDYEPNATVEASKAFRAGWDAARKVKSIDPPAPQWRQWVTDQAIEITGARATALEDILVCLAEIGYSAKGPLARIIAVCERQVGDGWRADPDQAHFSDGPKTVMWLLESLVRYFEPVSYRHTGNRAAYWLRDLCDGGAE